MSDKERTIWQVFMQFTDTLQSPITSSLIVLFVHL
jgi:hypothetical protein